MFLKSKWPGTSSYHGKIKLMKFLDTLSVHSDRCLNINKGSAKNVNGDVKMPVNPECGTTILWARAAKLVSLYKSAYGPHRRTLHRTSTGEFVRHRTLTKTIAHSCSSTVWASHLTYSAQGTGSCYSGDLRCSSRRGSSYLKRKKVRTGGIAMLRYRSDKTQY